MRPSQHPYRLWRDSRALGSKTRTLRSCDEVLDAIAAVLELALSSLQWTEWERPRVRGSVPMKRVALEHAALPAAARAWPNAPPALRDDLMLQYA